MPIDYMVVSFIEKVVLGVNVWEQLGVGNAHKEGVNQSRDERAWERGLTSDEISKAMGYGTGRYCGDWNIHFCNYWILIDYQWFTN